MNFPYQWCKNQAFNTVASIIFYTSIPMPYVENLKFDQVARFAPAIGLIIGGILGLFDIVANFLEVPVFTRSALVVVSWIAITGGLHLDGAMDTADGLAVMDKERRLEVMSDSATGAFGAMAAIILVLLKTVALIDIQENRWLILMAACGWARWGQILAIARYDYLKPTGKGAFHKQAIRSYKDVLPSVLLLLSLSAVMLLFDQSYLLLAIAIAFTGSTFAFLTGAWFNHKLGGHTGDTYGAVVEWTEALFLCVMTIQ
ncbi:MAG: adenosylcobinamide-GDP ribazoletransferase [Richelia sp. RM2_1_2]|nr:adenosylcobinamide-GDP ribazoletransferase [Richelia sp. SM2_1_7]NJM20078.1 adenosylcobinamide-GDP ribazoletransferase [Richelia sp. SM1_7_0]NJO31544.1 adenosylcobinamide-GDP ribazoletransferase [Richelia sp. SL_2_1]NJO60748.1 adenosylcobinamide-GDP ribazoletransferase [Richelia sp. RM2_1_2]